MNTYERKMIMKPSTKKLIINLFQVIFFGICTLASIWICLSVLNVGFNSGDPDTVKNIWEWNFFKLCVK